MVCHRREWMDLGISGGGVTARGRKAGKRLDASGAASVGGEPERSHLASDVGGVSEWRRREFWSFMRMAMARGANIGVDYATGKFGYEQYSAHLDAEASYFAQQYLAHVLPPEPPK